MAFLDIIYMVIRKFKTKGYFHREINNPVCIDDEYTQINFKLLISNNN